jgi:prepilin-type N-terminal cleavage/methylation domain-containing protein
MRTSKRSTQDGFSLLELIVSVGVLTIVMGAAFQLMTRSQSSFDRNEFLAEAHQNADFAVNRVAEIIRGAGANPHNDAFINSLTPVKNVTGLYSGQTSAQAVEIVADLNGDKDTLDPVDSGTSGAKFFILSSEDLVLLFVKNDNTSETIGGNTTTVAQGGTLVMIDKNRTPIAPVVIAENIVDFKCPVTSNPTEVQIDITAGPSHNISPTDRRYVQFTRTMQVRLRNRN